METVADQSDNDLSIEIARTLRGLVRVPRFNKNGLMTCPDFWRRCQLIASPWHDVGISRIFVDGFARCCYWNSWKVYTDALEPGITLWAGYACFGSGWSEHAWCMLDKQVIETTAYFQIYYGAELNEVEREKFGRVYGQFDLLERQPTEVWTIKDGGRQTVPYDAEIYRDTIGRQRDWETGQVNEGLRRE